ncbi:hypothetical protein HZH68_010568 [Vespula germanica]|uniref:Uncharacterized protein n=1 Tax=Vespula germanica TaxID=30212 RepID=A0A834JVJ9_VESGE|nr:hypothetical protein HZH68_010568 [Vespula germanica]
MFLRRWRKEITVRMESGACVLDVRLRGIVFSVPNVRVNWEGKLDLHFSANDQYTLRGLLVQEKVGAGNGFDLVSHLSTFTVQAIRNGARIREYKFQQQFCKT